MLLPREGGQEQLIVIRIYDIFLFNMEVVNFFTLHFITVIRWLVLRDDGSKTLLLLFPQPETLRLIRLLLHHVAQRDFHIDALSLQDLFKHLAALLLLPQLL